VIAYGLRRAANIHLQGLSVGKQDRSRIKHHKPAVVWFTGLSGSGKSTIANLVETRLYAHGVHTILLDGDNIRHGLNKDLGFTELDRVENIRRIGEVAKLMTEAGLMVLCSFISPFRAERAMVRDLVGKDEFIEIFVDTPLAECIARDPKGLYKKAMAGEIEISPVSLRVTSRRRRPRSSSPETLRPPSRRRRRSSRCSPRAA